MGIISARIVFLAMGVTLLQACSEQVQPVEQSGPVIVDARTVIVQPGSWRRNFKAYGLVRPAEEFEIGVEVSSTVKEVLFREGQSIEVGDLLLRLDAKKLRLRLEGARASVEEARANHEQARSTHRRNQSIYQSGVISEQTYLQSEANLKTTQANLRRSMSSYEIASEEYADAEVKSPVNGVVTKRNIEQGQSVSPMDHLGVIRVTGALRVETFVSQKDINTVRIGMPASITSPGVPGQLFSGLVDRIASSAETSTGNFEVGVVVEEGGAMLRDGMSAMVEFKGKPQEGLLAIPRSALIDRGRRLIVYRVEEGVARAVEPLLGVGNSSLVPVYSGLDSGDEIIVSNLRLISDSQHIRRIDNQAEG